MSRHKTREDKTCLNCGTRVEDRFCGHCGQENIETRQSFGHLVKHFVEDITHYEGSFWRTIKYLLFRPGFLTREYLAGKRNSFLPPVRLYIFISFVTFFIPYLLPDSSEDYQYPLAKNNKTDTSTNSGYGAGMGNGRMFYAKSNFKSVQELDSFERKLPPEKRFNSFQYRQEKKIIELSKRDPDELEDEFLSTFSKNFPKALFVYMPLFALIIRLFHYKKNQMYFDHAIFTIHYFSFILLVFTFLNIVNTTLTVPALFSNEANAQIFIIITVGLALAWSLYYFFKAHHTMYEEFWFISALKSTTMLILNMSLFFILIFVLGYLTMMILN